MLAFVAALVYLYDVEPYNTSLWRIFFAVYTGISAGLVGLSYNQLRIFFKTKPSDYHFPFFYYEDKTETGETYEVEK